MITSRTCAGELVTEAREDWARLVVVHKESYECNLPASLDDAPYALCCYPKPQSPGHDIGQTEASIIEGFVAEGSSLSLLQPEVTGPSEESPTDSPTVTIEGGFHSTDSVESLTDTATITSHTLASEEDVSSLRWVSSPD